MENFNKKLNSLGFYGLSLQLDECIELATKNQFTPKQLIEYIVHMETLQRSQRSLERRSQRAHIGRFKPMADFNWAWPKKIDQEAVESAFRLEFLEGGRNLILVASQGLGKTMIARNICHQAVMKGHSALFITASQCLLDLSSQDSPRGLERRLKHYCQPTILCLDELGYLSYDNRNADLLFQLISRRYEKKSLILTTNLPFSDWPTIFPNAACTTALIDRAVHRSEILVIEGSSYRLHEAENAKNARRLKAKISANRNPN